MKHANEIKDDIQRQAHATWMATGRCGTISAGTGFGKTRVAILELQRMYEQGMLTGPEDVLLVTPTTVLRDGNWPQEFADWGASDILEKHVKSICFASLRKEQGNQYKLVILDEVHRITDLAAIAFEGDENAEDDLTTFFAQNLTDACIGLTATAPDSKTEPAKARIVAQVAPVIFSYSLDQGVADGLIADYRIRVIQFELDDTKRVIPAGSKAKPFLTTERKAYDYLEKSIKRFRAIIGSTTDLKEVKKAENLLFIKTMQRNRFIGSVPSKRKLAERCLKQIYAQGKRTLVFCSDIQQANDLLYPNVYHSKSGKEAFEKFNNLESDLLGVVNAANEGINFVDLDQAMIIQMDSNARKLTQRIGRCLRIREGHIAVIYILCAQDTVDENWLKKSLEGFDPAKVCYYSEKAVPA